MLPAKNNRDDNIQHISYRCFPAVWKTKTLVILQGDTTIKDAKCLHNYHCGRLLNSHQFWSIVCNISVNEVSTWLRTEWLSTIAGKSLQHSLAQKSEIALIQNNGIFFLEFSKYNTNIILFLVLCILSDPQLCWSSCRPKV